MSNALTTTARPVAQPPCAAAGEPTQYLTFMLGGEAFAIGILSIKEIIEYHGLTTVPMMPDCVRGVINLRGAVVPVIDLQARFGRASSPVTKRTCIVIVEMQSADQERQVIGVLVDVVNEVIEISAGDIEPAPSFGAGIRSEYIAGMGKVRGRFVILLQVDAVLSLDEGAALTRPEEVPLLN
ncbi:MAG TPA: chemotaxis protein CheW [Burkholderiaceae bacterium]|nr:chemotaxis protein CheW [Burkholderiaceae bacterium]